MNGMFKNDEAVSPVIGVILMVAITVILAAAVTVFVFGETDKLDSANKFVALQGSANAKYVTVEITGGSDLAELSEMKITFDGAAPEYVVVNGVFFKDTVQNGNWTAGSGILLPTAINGTDPFSDNAFSAGDTIKLPNEGGKLSIVGTFADGTEQTIYSKTYASK